MTGRCARLVYEQEGMSKCVMITVFKNNTQVVTFDSRMWDIKP